MRDAVARRRAALAALALAVAAAAVIPAVSVAHDPRGIDEFMYAMGEVESGSRYDALNPVSGAYGKYQIMPSNWPAWAEKYLGDRDAPQTPRNQEIVARGKFHDLHRWLDSWRQVAYWWLTGRDGRDISWSSYATSYVRKVMTIYRERLASGVAGEAAVTRVMIQDRSAKIAYAGGWRSASHAGYTDGRVRYATKSGATASLTFTGRSVRWIGPEGPTRGRAVVSVDGVAVKTVDLYARSFDARSTLFSRRWAEAGTHTISIRVLGTRGRPYVAIDAFAITR